MEKNSIIYAATDWLLVSQSHSLTRRAVNSAATRLKKGSNRSTCRPDTAAFTRNYIAHSSSQSAQRATHLLPWFLAHLTDLPTHNRSADAFFRIGVKWRNGAVSTSCQRTADFHGMRRDSSQRAPSVTSSWQVYVILMNVVVLEKRAFWVNYFFELYFYFNNYFIIFYFKTQFELLEVYLNAYCSYYYYYFGIIHICCSNNRVMCDMFCVENAFLYFDNAE